MNPLKYGDAIQITIDWRGVSVSGTDVPPEADGALLLLVMNALGMRRDHARADNAYSVNLESE